MPFSLLSGLIGAGVQSLNNYGNRNWQSEEAEKARQYNTQMVQMQQAYNTAEREAAQQFNIDMWNMNNEYNDPRNQLARATAAGINPNAAVQGMSPAQSSPVTTSPQTSGAASTSPASLPSQFDVGSTLANSANGFWQNQLLMRQATGVDIDNKWKPKMNESQYNKTVAECTKLGVDTDKVRADIKAVEALTPEQVKLVAAQVDETRQKIRESVANVEKINVEKGKIAADTAFTQAQTDNAGKQGQILDKQVVQQDYIAYVSTLKKQLAENGILMDTDMLGRLIFADAWAQIKMMGERNVEDEASSKISDIEDDYRSGKITEDEYIQAIDGPSRVIENSQEKQGTYGQIAELQKRIMSNTISSYADTILGTIVRGEKEAGIDYTRHRKSMDKEQLKIDKERLSLQETQMFINAALGIMNTVNNSYDTYQRHH